MSGSPPAPPGDPGPPPAPPGDPGPRHHARPRGHRLQPARGSSPATDSGSTGSGGGGTIQNGGTSPSASPRPPTHSTRPLPRRTSDASCSRTCARSCTTWGRTPRSSRSSPPGCRRSATAARPHDQAAPGRRVQRRHQPQRRRGEDHARALPDRPEVGPGLRAGHGPVGGRGEPLHGADPAQAALRAADRDPGRPVRDDPVAEAAVQARRQNFSSDPVCVGPFAFKDRPSSDQIDLVKSKYYYDKDQVHSTASSSSSSPSPTCARQTCAPVTSTSPTGWPRRTCRP